MAKLGKKYKQALEKVDSERLYPLSEACELVVETKTSKFDETVEVAIRLEVDPKKADQNVRGSVPLPHGLGKEIRVIVFAKGDKAKEAEEAGAMLVGADDLVKKVSEGFLDFDNVVATPDMMSQVGKLGKVLGPRGLMPSPKVGSVTFDVGDAVKGIRAGRAEFRVEKAGIVHAAVGKVSFGGAKLTENINALLLALNKVKPSTSKGIYLKGGSISCTMGPGIKLDMIPFRTGV